eukprot:6194824-Pleurochrysis_carterae.AAC.3
MYAVTFVETPACMRAFAFECVARMCLLAHVRACERAYAAARTRHACGMCVRVAFLMCLLPQFGAHTPPGTNTRAYAARARTQAHREQRACLRTGVCALGHAQRRLPTRRVPAWAQMPVLCTCTLVLAQPRTYIRWHARLYAGTQAQALKQLHASLKNRLRAHV